MCGFRDMTGCSDIGSTTNVMVAKSVGKPTGESRKIRKPLMEKRRRARINQSLNELKKLLLDGNTSKKEGSRPAKLEKADILEMTVQHLQRLQQQQQEQLAKMESENKVSTQQQEKKPNQTWTDSCSSTNKRQEQHNFEQQEKCNRHKPSSTVPDALWRHQKQSEQMTDERRPAAQQRISSPGQRRHYEKLEGSSSPKFRAGFSECAREARELLNNFDDVDPAVRERLSHHLSSCLESLESKNDVSSSCSNHQAADSTQNNVAMSGGSEEILMQSSGSPSVLIQTPTGLTLLPTKLPNGDLAFVIPADIKKSVASCLNYDSARISRTKSDFQSAQESKQIEEEVVWRPW